MSSTYLRRYTDLTALIFLLHKKQITLLDPDSWDDSNDSHYLSIYKEKRKLKSVLALCFSETNETYHHWRVFANGSSGVCIKFKRSRLLKAIKKQSGLRMGQVEYLTLDKIKGMTLNMADLPFLKRYAFEHECEFRVVYESDSRRVRKLDIPIRLSCIDKITLSPWMHPDFATYIKRVLHDIHGCKGINIVRSTLIGNEQWKSLGEDAVLGGVTLIKNRKA
jgi:Protein of unknown function (DUF2971)